MLAQCMGLATEQASCLRLVQEVKGALPVNALAHLELVLSESGSCPLVSPGLGELLMRPLFQLAPPQHSLLHHLSQLEDT